MVKVYGYFKRGSNKPDAKCMGTPSAILSPVKKMMQDKDISTIVIENPENKHRFKWDPSVDNKWRCITQPIDSQISKMREEFEKSIAGAKTFRTPVITGSKAVLKINGQVVALAEPVAFKMEYSKK